MKNETMLIFNRRIALQLSRLGFPILDIVNNRNKPFIDIYVFEETPEIQKAFGEILSMRRKQTYQ